MAPSFTPALGTKWLFSRVSRSSTCREQLHRQGLFVDVPSHLAATSLNIQEVKEVKERWRRETETSLEKRSPSPAGSC